MTMLTDGLKSQNLEDRIQQMDVAELLERACVPQTIAAPALPGGSLSDVAPSEVAPQASV